MLHFYFMGVNERGPPKRGARGGHPALRTALACISLFLNKNGILDQEFELHSRQSFLSVFV
jgi:hypothetical protein